MGAVNKAREGSSRETAMEDAGAGSHFSIRGCAARVRGKEDGERSWPFGGAAGVLPPMEVRQFRWWADEVALAEEGEEGEEERRSADKRRKRSIVDLFAAVPRVAGNVGMGRGRRVRRKLDKEKLVVQVVAKKDLKKEKVAPDINLRKKEKSGNVKFTSCISQSFQDTKQKRKLKKSPSKEKRNKEVSIYLNKKIMKGNTKSHLANQKAIKNSCQVQSILGEHLRMGKSTFFKTTDVLCPSKPSLKSKHVTFSDKDGICGFATCQLGDTEQSKLLQAPQQPSQNGNSQVVDAQRNADEPHVVYQQLDGIAGTIEEDTSSLSVKVGATGVSLTVPVTKPKEKTIPCNTVDLKHWIEMSNRGNCFKSMSSPVLSSQPLAQNFTGVDFHLQHGLYPEVGCQKENHRVIRQGPSLPAGLVVETRSGDYMRSSLSQPSSSCLVASLQEAHDMSKSTLPQKRLDACCNLTEVHPSFLRSGKDLMGSISSSTGSNKSTDAQTTDCVSACRNMHFSDDYIGLPLNSHGEFVRVQPGGTLNPNEAFKRQCLGGNSLRPSLSTTLFVPKTCMGYANLRINHQDLPFYRVDNFGIQPEPSLAPTMPTAFGMGFRQLPSPERLEVGNYALLDNNLSCRNQQERSVQCFCSRCMGQDNQLGKSLEMQTSFSRQNYEQNVEPTAEPTMRLMGKTVTLGTSSKQCRGLDNSGSCCSKQIRAGDHYFHGTCTNVFPGLFHGDLVDPPRPSRVSNGERQPPQYPSCFSSVPTTELGCGFSTNTFRTKHSRQPQLAVPNRLFVQPVSKYSEVGLGHHRMPVPNQVQSTAQHLQLGPVHYRDNQSVAALPSYDPNDGIKQAAETRPPGTSQFSYFPQNFSNLTQRTPIPSFISGYSTQNSSALTTQTKFTSLCPLPPSMVYPRVYSTEAAQAHGSSTFHPSVPLSHGTGKFSTPGDTIFRDKRTMEQTAIGSSHKSSEQINISFTRPVEKGALFTLSKKPCMTVRKDLNLSPHLEERPELSSCRENGQTRGIPVSLIEEPVVNLVLVNNDTYNAWSDSVNVVRTIPAELQSGAKNTVQLCANPGMDGEDSWPVHSVMQFAVENDACAVGSSEKMDAEICRI